MRETFQQNKAILSFASLFSGSVATMLLMDHSSNIAAIVAAFIALTALSFLAITLVWRYASQK
ncbi:hypothetical protein [Corynebacterium gerontici]|uniref:Uncharacterized protein n=1 Tax=Corynebacterium gerontici TaxID=2079234 RepID=A0A3G6J5Y2_9CORY|nr:hypothetical protein [Corynebacterium gerontici]AZA12338.1 hypothetical protein CGERO_10270 [Corynebacterium gerontici]